MLLSLASYSIPEPEEVSCALRAAEWNVCVLAVTGNRLVSACKTVFSRLKSPSDSLLLTKLQIFKLSSVFVLNLYHLAPPEALVVTLNAMHSLVLLELEL